MSAPTRTLSLPRPTRRLLFGSRLLDRLLRHMSRGSLRIVLPDGQVCERHATPGTGLSAALRLHRWRAVRRLMIEGDLGFAEAYLDGDWDTPDLAALLRLGLANEAALAATTRTSLLTRTLRRVIHRVHANTRAGSRRNIAAHYDLGNEFYSAWLDRGMSYSSALYTLPAPVPAHVPVQTLEQAQTAKQDRVIALLGVPEGGTVLEIGCGWGGLAERLARSGLSVTGITLSRAQLAYATHRLGEAGLPAELRLQDYRDIARTFDGVVAVEMFEAVGEAYWPVFFERLRAMLRPGGSAVLQIITIAEARFAAYRAHPDFIQRHIFPGGMLPTRAALYALSAHAGLRVVHEETFAASYARTLRCWAQRFEAAWPRLAGGGFDARFRRKWLYYLAYCEAGFDGGALDVGLYRLVHA